MNPNKLRQIVEVIAHLKSLVKCAICLDHIKNTAELACGHKFCSGCLLRVRSEALHSCPICKKPINKRLIVYKDQFADDLVKFVDQSCQLIKEKYACEVEKIQVTDKQELQKIIESSPQDGCISLNVKKFELMGPPSNNQFNNLKGLPRRCYSNRRKAANNHKVLNFNDNDTRAKIINWLNDNQEKLDTFTQSPSFVGNPSDVEDFEMPSISQAKINRKSKLHRRLRSQSFTEKEKSSEPLVKKYHSLTEGLDEDENYLIEDVGSEALVKQVERRVVQEILEDDCLEKLEQAAKDSKKNQKIETRKKSTPEAPSVNSGSSSGWDRIRKVKKALSKSLKEPKKLSISLQENNNAKPSFKRKSSEERTKRKSNSPKSKNRKCGDKENLKAPAEMQDSSRPGPSNTTKRKTFNLSALEIYFEKHLDKVAILPDENNSSDLDIMEINKPEPEPDPKDNSLDEDIFLIPTQRTSLSANEKKTICYVAPVSQGIDDVKSIVIRLGDVLNSCLISATSLIGDAPAQALVECFKNLKTYVDKIHLLDDKEKKENRPVAAVAIQTEKVNTVENGMQVNMSPKKIFMEMGIQTSLKVTQEKAVQTSVEKSLKAKLFSQSTNIKETKKKEAFFKAEQSTEVDLDKPIRSGSSGNPKAGNISQGSLLLCSLGPSASDTSKKINRKLTYQESQNRKFKRIRKPTSDSDSDDHDEKPSKKRFLRNDLTVEFLDSEKPGNEEDTSDSGSTSYDKYLLEVMDKYGTTPPKNPPQKINQDKKSSVPLPDPSSQSQSSISKQFKKKTQVLPDSESHDEHIFTSHLSFENNLAQIEQEIKEHEKEENTYNTELDLVENTPLLGPKPKIPRLKQGQPIQIVSRGSVSSGSPKKVVTLTQSSILNRNIEDFQQTETEKKSDEVNAMLEDLKNDETFFNTDMESLDKEVMLKSSSNHETNNLNVTQENIDKILENINDFENDIGVDAELEKISFPSEELKNQKINILKNIRLRSQRRMTEDDVIDASDVSDEEIVETTPQKPKNNSTRNRSKVIDLEEQEEDLDVCLPPPPGFGDEMEFVDNNEEPDNKPPQISSSLTPDRFSQLLKPHAPEPPIPVQREESQLSLTFTQNRNFNKAVQNSPGFYSQTPGLLFTPTAKLGRTTQSKYTPLVTTHRSSTKKATLMTSTPNQKSILNYVRPSQNSPGASQSQKSKPCITYSCIYNKDPNLFKQLEVKKLLTVSLKFTPEVTHVVVLVDEKGHIVSSTAKILLAITSGIWVVRYEWALDCLRMNRIVPEEPYEVLDFSGNPGPKIARTKADSPPFLRYKFYCALTFPRISKDDIEKILQLAGAEVVKDIDALLDEDEKIKIIIVDRNDSTATEENDQFDTWLELYRVVTVHIEWISKCIGQYKVVSFRHDLLCSEELFESALPTLEYPATLVEVVPNTLTEPMLL